MNSPRGASVARSPSIDRRTAITWFTRIAAGTAVALGDVAGPDQVASQTGPCVAPAPPFDLSSSVTGSLVALAWNAPTTGSPATSYRIEAGSASGSANLYNDDVGNVTAVNARAPNGLYFVRVRSVNACGTSAPSNEVSFGVPACSVEQAVCFIRSLISPSGLVRSLQNEDFTTVYKNALAAMVFLHHGDRADARRIFDVFKQYYDRDPARFRGFPKDWRPDSGLPYPQGDRSEEDYYWVGDGSCLLLALQYHRAGPGSDLTKYDAVMLALIRWLSQRSDRCEGIVAEGVANMYAALAPFRSISSIIEINIEEKLDHLRACYRRSSDHANVLDHTVRSALIFDDLSGFSQHERFRRTEAWCRNNRTSVTAFAAFASHSYINVEISAQLLLAWKLRRPSGIDLSFLSSELEKLWIGDATCMGLPYLVTPHDFQRACSDAIVDSTAFMLFACWEFNPFAPPTLVPAQ